MAKMKSLFNLINNSDDLEKRFLEDFVYAKEQNKVQRLPSQTYKPSSMKCIRNMYYQVTGCPNRVSDSNYILDGITESGSDRHQRLQEDISKMKSAGIDCEFVNVGDFIREKGIKSLTIVKEANFEKGIYETKLRHEELNLSFLCDGILKYLGKYYILEIKTETSSKFMKRKDIAEEHLMQGATYSMVFGIEDILFMYENRDIPNKKIYIKTFSKQERDIVLEKIKTCDKYVEQKQVPPKTEDISACKYCDYKGQCRNDG